MNHAASDPVSNAEKNAVNDPVDNAASDPAGNAENNAAGDPVNRVQQAAGPVVVLVGPPGSGKSTVAALLADRLGKEHRDTDTDVEKTAGMPISDIFVDFGEAHFRRLERDAVSAALAGAEVLSLGGGAILDPQTRADLAGHPVVFLDVSLGEAAKRVGLGVARPLLLGNVRTQLKNLMDARRPLYAEVAKVVVETDGKTPDEIADEILGRLA